MQTIEPTSDINPTEGKVFNILKEQFERKCGVNSILLPKYYLLLNNKRDCEIIGYFSPKPGEKWITSDGKIAYNLFVLFEVKSHSNFEIRQNNQVVVGYSDGTKDALAQADMSSRKLQDHLRANGVQGAWVYTFICFPNISLYKDDNYEEYKNYHGYKFILLNEEISFDTIIQKCSYQKMAAREGLTRFSSIIDPNLDYSQRDNKILKILSGIAKPTQIGKFDKKRLEGIAQGKIKIDDYLTALDENDLVLTGKAGSGKTIVLLKLAISQVEYFKHVLILTYNTVLASDINRLLEYYFEHYNPSLIKHREHLKIINIDQLVWDYDFTVCHYTYEKLPLSEDYDSNYNIKIDRINKFIDNVGVQDARDALNFNYDFILIDEGQDFEEKAFNLIERLNNHKARIFLVDSPDQLLKYPRPSILDTNDWAKRARNTNYRNFKKINKYSNKLRRYLKKAITKVGQNIVSDNIEDDAYSIQMPDGNIEIFEDELLFKNDKLKQIIEDTAQKCDGEKWPLLFVQSKTDNKKEQLFDYLKKIRCEYWDGYDPIVRKSVLYDTKSIRVIDYESCRGLEGWTVVLRNIDIGYVASLNHTNDIEKEKAIERACNLIFIAASRPIENLIITYTDKQFGEVLLKYAENL